MRPFIPYEQRTVPELQVVLRARDLKVGGRKNDLVDRLKKHDREHPFPFFRLPGEIRNMIYEYAAKIQADWHPKLDPTHSCRSRIFHQKQIEQPSLLRACRQSRMEGLPYFYKISQFTFIPNKLAHYGGKWDGLWSWLSSIQLNHGQHIRHIKIWILPRNIISTSSLQRFMNEIKSYDLYNATITLQARHLDQLKFIARLANFYIDAKTQYKLLMRYQQDGKWHSKGEMKDFDLDLHGVRWSRAAVDFSLPADIMEE